MVGKLPARTAWPRAAESEKGERVHGGHGVWSGLVDAWSPVPIEIAVRSFHPPAKIFRGAGARVAMGMGLHGGDSSRDWHRTAADDGVEKSASVNPGNRRPGDPAAPGFGVWEFYGCFPRDSGWRHYFHAKIIQGKSGIWASGKSPDSSHRESPYPPQR